MSKLSKRLTLVLAGVTSIALSTQGADAYGQQSYLDLLDDYAEEIEVAAAPAPAPSTPMLNNLSVSKTPIADTGAEGVSQRQFEGDLEAFHPASYRVYSALAAYEQRLVYRAFLRNGSFGDAIRAIRTSINAHND